jgi:hypothetical protein
MNSYVGNSPTTGHFPTDTFTSSGGSTYTLSKAPATLGSIEVSVQGVLQAISAYSISGTTLTLAGVASGDVVFVRHLGETLQIPTPGDDSVTTAKIAADAVDGTKIAADAVDGTKIADNAIDSDHYVDGSVDNAHLATGIDAGKLINALPQISGAALTNLPESGDKRNFIIDGDFTQWPEGNITAASSGDYGPALFGIYSSVGTLVVNLTEETSVLPTVAQSGHQSDSCVKIDVTTAEAAFTGTEYFSFLYRLTGTDYQHLHGQECTLVFWIRSGITGQSSVSFCNASGNRQYIAPYTINSADTWEKKTITLTMDTSGTWTFTEADRGLMIRWNIGAGPDRNTGTNNQWNGDYLYSAAGDVNLASDATKDIYISQVGLYLGSTAPTFTSPPIATVRDQVDYYIQKSYEDGVNPGTSTYTNLQYSQSWATNNTLGFQFPKPMRAEPSVDVYSKLGTTNKLSLVTGSGFADIGTVNALDLSNKGVRYLNDTGNGLTTGNLHAFHWVADARH